MKYIRTEQQTAAWFKQQSSSHITYALKIGTTYNSRGIGKDVVLALTICDGHYYRTKLDTMDNWFPKAQAIPENIVPEKVAAKILKRLNSL